jgi:hypothetical protein
MLKRKTFFAQKWGKTAILTQMTAEIRHKKDNNIGFKEKWQFFAENWRKSPIITLTPLDNENCE